LEIYSGTVAKIIEIIEIGRHSTKLLRKQKGCSCFRHNVFAQCRYISKMRQESITSPIRSKITLPRHRHNSTSFTRNQYKNTVRIW